MNILYGILILLVILGIIVTILAYIGLGVQRKEQKYIDEYNEKALKTFEKANKNKKYNRASTPKVPSVK